MEENFNTYGNPFVEQKRSQFLQVICILSFTMCGLGLLSGIWSIYQSTPEKMTENIEQVRAVNEEMADQMENNMIEMMNNPFSKIAPYLGLVYTLISFLGVMQMWNRKKTGFYIYTVAEILPYTSMLLMGASSLKMMGPPGSSTFIAMAVIGLMVIFDIAFIIMYATRLKEMDK